MKLKEKIDYKQAVQPYENCIGSFFRYKEADYLVTGIGLNVETQKPEFEYKPTKDTSTAIENIFESDMKFHRECSEFLRKFEPEGKPTSLTNKTKQLISNYVKAIKKGNLQLVQKKKEEIAKKLQDDLHSELISNFARQFMILQPVGRGIDAVVEVGSSALSINQAKEIVNTKYHKIYPPIIENNCKVRLDFELDCKQDFDYYTDMLGDAKMNISVNEDRMFLNLLRATVKLNPVKVKDFNIGVLDMLATELPKCPFTLLVGKGTWDSILDNGEFLERYEATSYKLIMNGNLGYVKLKRKDEMIKVGIVTDAFREPYLKVLNPDEFFLLPFPVDTGVICEQKHLMVETNVVDSLGNKFDPQEFYCEEIIGMVLKAYVGGRI